MRFVRSFAVASLPLLLACTDDRASAEAQTPFGGGPSGGSAGSETAGSGGSAGAPEVAGSGGSNTGALGGQSGTGGNGGNTGGHPNGGTSGTGATGGTNNDDDPCANAGCALPPLCSEGCNELCGCCHCYEGEIEARNGAPHRCTNNGCYEPIENTEAKYVSLELDFVTSGGLDGNGNGSYRIEDGSIAFNPPQGPVKCVEPLTVAQVDALLSLAGDVDWGALSSDYFPPDNPDCCCDMLVWSFAVSLDTGLASESYETGWCDWTLLPDDLVPFLKGLEAIGNPMRHDSDCY